MKIKFLDGSVKEYPGPVSPLQIAAEISPSLAKRSVYAKSMAPITTLTGRSSPTRRWNS